MVLDPLNQQYGPIGNVREGDNGSQKKHSYRMILITAIVLLIGIGGIMVSQNKNLQEIVKNSINFSKAPTDVKEGTGDLSMKATVITERTQPWLEVVSADGKSTYTKDETVTVTINAHSGGSDITGYDLLVGFDKSMFDVTGITSEVQGFTIFPFEREAYTTVTGIKEISRKDPTPFDNTPLIKVMLKPKKTGTSLITIFPNNGQETTKMVDNQVEVIKSQIGSFQVEVK